MITLVLMAMLVWAAPSWAVQVVTGSYAGDGTDNRNITISPACQPLAVFLQRSDAAWGGQVFLSSMSTNSSGEYTGTSQNQADRIQQMNADGFQVGTQSYVNASGSAYRYMAVCDNSANDVAVGTYAGNAGDNRDITISPAFQPEVVIVFPSNGGLAPWRGATSHSGDTASFLNSAAADAPNYIQQFNANGFQVGTSANSNAVNYYYLALKGSASGVVTGSFSGNGSDNRDITTPGFQPEFVLVKGNSTTKKVATRYASQSGDLSFCADAAEVANIVQSFISTGFQVGTDTCTNENAVTMRWAAFADVAAPTGGGHSMLLTGVGQ